MSPDERLVVLEQEVARLRSVLQEFGTLIQEAGGEQNMMFAAVLALIESASNPKELGPVLRRELDSVETTAVFQAAHEGQLEGAQAAHANFLRALETSESQNLNDQT
jgi:hypothetical protein